MFNKCHKYLLFNYQTLLLIQLIKQMGYSQNPRTFYFFLLLNLRTRFNNVNSPLLLNQNEFYYYSLIITNFAITVLYIKVITITTPLYKFRSLINRLPLTH